MYYMKYFIFTLCLAAAQNKLCAQIAGPALYSKPRIDSVAVNTWPHLNNEPIVSNNGNYFSYILYNGPQKHRTLFVQSTNNLWKKEIVNATPVTFSEDTKQFICLVKDMLQFIKLGEDGTTQFVEKVQSWKQPGSRQGKWLAWKLDDLANTLVIRDLISGKDRIFQNIKEYDFDERGNVLLMKTASHELLWLDLKRLTPEKIWSPLEIPGKESVVSNYAIDKQGMQLAFIVRASNNPFEATIWYYRSDYVNAVPKIDNASTGFYPNLHLGTSLRFSNDGRYIYTTLKKAPDPKPLPGYVKLDVWSYKDTILQSAQLNEGRKIEPGQYDAVMEVESGHLIRLCNDRGDFIKVFPQQTGDFIIVGNNNSGDRFWIKETDSNWLVSLIDGSRKALPVKGGEAFSFSPDGRYLFYYDLDNHHYFSYSLLSGKLSNITAGVQSGFFERKEEYYHPYNDPTASVATGCVGQAGWLKGTNKVLVYDDYDIWRLDLTGIEGPINMTNGFGRKNHIKFRLLTRGVLLEKESLLLTAFNVLTKENGFYRLRLAEIDPELLVLKPYTYFHSPVGVINPEEIDAGMVPVKARNANKWIVKRQSTNEAPNFYLTADFKQYKALTDIHPEKKYNWFNAELINWKQEDGLATQGVLYKPENFDSTKRYPVIFVIYEQLSHRLYEYPLPDFSTDIINIPWFVSRDYLVFTPDIHFTTGQIGASALKTVTSAVQTLAGLPFIDSTRLAIIGHSYSGQMIYHVVTHSNLFAAAIASAGVSDQVSGSLQLEGHGLIKKGSRLYNAEHRLGASLWERPDLYLAEMPVLQAHKVRTPILILHSITDDLPWEQAVEMFIALRRNEKKTWMLQYHNSGHSLYGKDAVDYTYRLEQFLGHYLKQAPAPKWMTSGIRASHKGIDTGFEFDNKASCGIDCRICNEK